MYPFFLEADNKAELIQQLRLYPQAVVILDYTLFDFAGADELIVLQERFKRGRLDSVLR